MKKLVAMAMAVIACGLNESGLDEAYQPRSPQTPPQEDPPLMPEQQENKDQQGQFPENK